MNFIRIIRRYGPGLFFFWCLLMGILLLLCIKKVQAASTWGTVLEFDSQGSLVMTTHDKAATSNISYRTIGWTVKKEDSSIGSEGNQCASLKLEMTGSEPDNQNVGYVYTHFLCGKDLVFDRISQASALWAQELYSQGGIVYLDAIMTVCENGILQGGMDENGRLWGEVYTDYDGIAGARRWNDKEGLRTHFNQRVYFPANPQMLKTVCRIHYMELRRDGDYENAWELSRYGKDETMELEDSPYTISAADLSSHFFSYSGARIVAKERSGKENSLFQSGTQITLSNESDVYETVDIYFYYTRQEKREEARTVGRTPKEMMEAAKFSVNALGEKAFQPEKGIPSGESLLLKGEVYPFSINAVYVRHYGYETIPVTVDVTYELKWKDTSGSRSEELQRRETYYVDRYYSYYTIKEVAVYELKKLVAEGHVLPEKTVEIAPYKSVRMVCTRQKEREYYVNYTGETLNTTQTVWGEGRRPETPEASLQSWAEEQAGQLQVRNDTLQAGGVTYLDGWPCRLETAGPKKDGNSEGVSFCTTGHQIPKKTKNGLYDIAFQGVYQELFSSTSVSEKAPRSHKVTVHTPVVCNADCSDEKEWNQQSVPTEKNSLILGRSFRVSIKAEGEHLDIPGYGKRNYAEYVQCRQVKFPFAVYYDGAYITPESWVTLKTEKETFDLPPGVKPGEYEIQCRTLARNKNDEEENDTEEGANLSMEHYGAHCEIPVCVVGRLYGFAVTEIVDYPRWQQVFWKPDGKTSTGIVYRSGTKDENGQPLPTSRRYVIPIMEGSHPYNSSVRAIGLGYRVKFQLKTMGDFDSQNSYIRIQPVFYWMDENLQNRVAVDLYYDMPNGKNLIKVGSREDLSNVHRVDDVPVYSYGRMILSQQTRSYAGPLKQNGTDASAAIKSVQVWSGEYSLPSELYVVKRGFDLDAYAKDHGGIIKGSEPVFLQGGFILVRMKIAACQQGEPVLLYGNLKNSTAGYCNMWKTEGFFTERKGLAGKSCEFLYGDTLLFDVTRSMLRDYESLGTH